ncbi:MAG: hypothetical protein JST73_10790, partial [Actinobacteria bacterium]|nr:hypothetical protein [Actinomycetota bacterium]
ELTLAATEDRVLDLVTELGDSQARVNELQEQLVGLLVSGRVIDPVPGDRYFADIDCCTDAARSARRHLGGIMLPEAACHDLAELDRRLEAKSWGQTAWRALMALHAFASDTSFAPGFWEWCVAGRSPLTWPASSKKLAMHESESVMQNDALRAQRLFPIDERVDPSGRIIMEAHIKIVTGGGPQIPRIYFYDDRHGPTGKVHIGFFGPHWRVPTATTG